MQRREFLQFVAMASGVSALHGSALAAAVTPPAQAPPGTQGLVSPCPGCGYPPAPIDDTDRTGWTSIFDGRSLDGWDGNPAVWSVAGGAITAESTAARRSARRLRARARDERRRRHPQRRLLPRQHQAAGAAARPAARDPGGSEM